MNVRRRIAHSGITGWVLLVGLVLTWDYVHLKNGESMSCAFARGARHSATRVPVTLTWAVLTLHLFGVLPHKLDPFYQLAQLATRGTPP